MSNSDTICIARIPLKCRSQFTAMFGHFLLLTSYFLPCPGGARRTSNACPYRRGKRGRLRAVPTSGSVARCLLPRRCGERRAVNDRPYGGTCGAHCAPLPLRKVKNAPASNEAEAFFKCNRVCKPGSVLDSHLSCRAVADTLHATSPETAGPANVSSTVLLRIEFTAPDSLQPASELLPRLSTLTGK